MLATSGYFSFHASSSSSVVGAAKDAGSFTLASKVLTCSTNLFWCLRRSSYRFLYVFSSRVKSLSSSLTAASLVASSATTTSCSCSCSLSSCRDCISSSISFSSLSALRLFAFECELSTKPATLGDSITFSSGILYSFMLAVASPGRLIVD